MKRTAYLFLIISFFVVGFLVNANFVKACTTGACNRFGCKIVCSGAITSVTAEVFDPFHNLRSEWNRGGETLSVPVSVVIRMDCVGNSGGGYDNCPSPSYAIMDLTANCGDSGTEHHVTGTASVGAYSGEAQLRAVFSDQTCSFAGPTGVYNITGGTVTLVQGDMNTGQKSVWPINASTYTSIRVKPLYSGVDIETPIANTDENNALPFKPTIRARAYRQYEGSQIQPIDAVLNYKIDCESDGKIDFENYSSRYTYITSFDQCSYPKPGQYLVTISTTYAGKSLVGDEKVYVLPTGGVSFAVNGSADGIVSSLKPDASDSVKVTDTGVLVIGTTYGVNRPLNNTDYRPLSLSAMNPLPVATARTFTMSADSIYNEYVSLTAYCDLYGNPNGSAGYASINVTSPTEGAKSLSKSVTCSYNQPGTYYARFKAYIEPYPLNLRTHVFGRSTGYPVGIDSFTRRLIWFGFGMDDQYLVKTEYDIFKKIVVTGCDAAGVCTMKWPFKIQWSVDKATECALSGPNVAPNSKGFSFNDFWTSIVKDNLLYPDGTLFKDQNGNYLYKRQGTIRPISKPTEEYLQSLLKDGLIETTTPQNVTVPSLPLSIYKLPSTSGNIVAPEVTPGTYTYTLSCINKYGETKNKPITVKVISE